MNTVVQKRPAYALESVDKALQLMQVLRDSGSLRLVDAARELQVSASSAHRLLSMLVYRGFAVQDDGRVYRPGPSLGERPLLGFNTPALKERVRPYLEELSATTGWTSNLMILVGRNTRILLMVGPGELSRDHNRQGAVLPADRTSGGRALLSGLDEPQLRALYHVTDIEREHHFEQLLEELRRVRHAGFAINKERTENGVCAVGAAVRSQGRGIAAVTVSFPASVYGSPDARKTVDALLAATRRIEHDLAAQPIGALQNRAG